MAETRTFLPRSEREQRLPDGTRIFIELEDPLDLGGKFGDVAEHEAEHAVVAIRNGTPIIEASIIPQGNSLGHVLLSRPDAVATATSHGRAGSAGDHALVHSLGLDFASVAKTSHAIKNKNRRAVSAVAGALAKKKFLSGGDVQAIVDQIDKGERVRVRIVTPDGKEEILSKRVQHGQKVAVEIKLFEKRPDGQKKASAPREQMLSAADLPKSDIVTDTDLRKAA